MKLRMKNKVMSQIADAQDQVEQEKQQALLDAQEEALVAENTRQGIEDENNSGSEEALERSDEMEVTDDVTKDDIFAQLEDKKQ